MTLRKALNRSSSSHHQIPSFHLRVPVRNLTANQSRIGLVGSSIRSFSSHDDRLSKQDVVDRVLDVVKSFPKVDPSKVTPQVNFEKDLGLDSLDTVEIVMAIEEEFKLEIPYKKLIRDL